MRERLRSLSERQAAVGLAVAAVVWLALLVGGFAHGWLWLAAAAFGAAVIGLACWADY